MSERGLTFTVNVPVIPFGPDGVDPAARDARQYRQAAKKIRSNAARGQEISGSNLTEAVARLCDAAAAALEAYGAPAPILAPRPQVGVVVRPSESSRGLAWTQNTRTFHVVQQHGNPRARAVCGATADGTYMFPVTEYRRPPVTLAGKSFCTRCADYTDELLSRERAAHS